MKKQKGGIEILVLLLVVVASFILAGGLNKFKISTPQNSGIPVDIKNIIPSAGYKNLQIKSLQASTPIPSAPITPPDVCSKDTGESVELNCKCDAFHLECKSKKCERLIDVGSPAGFPTNLPSPNPNPTKSCDYYIQFGQSSINIHSFFDNWCSDDKYTQGLDGIFCIGKPVIYLYPTIDTIVNVKLNIPGKIVESIPFYPEEGWQNILAHPNGSLEYMDKNYNELYYESAINKVNPPKKGLVVEKNKLEKELKTLIFKLGLIGREQTEFLDYWMPKLKELNNPYIFVSVIEKAEKERIDNVVINPAPDTRIEFLAYFKGLDKKVKAEPLILPDIPPKRVGFTAVEWGGTIDRGD